MRLGFPWVLITGSLQTGVPGLVSLGAGYPVALQVVPPASSVSLVSSVDILTFPWVCPQPGPPPQKPNDGLQAFYPLLPIRSQDLSTCASEEPLDFVFLSLPWLLPWFRGLPASVNCQLP